MSRYNKTWITAIAAVCVLAGWLAIRHGHSDKMPLAAAAIPVSPGKPQLMDIPNYVRGLGTVQAFNTVTVKSRVDGQITQVLFSEGQEVKAGDPLFQIDSRPYQATFDQLQANLARDQAQLEGAQLNLDRYSKLITTGFQTRQSYDDQKATVAQLQASIKADQALIESGKLNLEFTTIRAPISGRTSERLVDQGNFVQTAQGTPLVTIGQLKPIFVVFSVTQKSLDLIRQNQGGAPLKVYAYGDDNKTILAEGALTVVNNRVDTTSGTVELKAAFGNEDERLWPGEFVNVRLVLSLHKNAVTVPSQTVMQGPAGAFVYLIQPDDTVNTQSVEVLATQDGLAIIGKGLSVEDNVVVSGQYRLSNGVKVKTTIQPATPNAAMLVTPPVEKRP